MATATMGRFLCSLHLFKKLARLHSRIRLLKTLLARTTFFVGFRLVLLHICMVVPLTSRSVPIRWCSSRKSVWDLLLKVLYWRIKVSVPLQSMSPFTLMVLTRPGTSPIIHRCSLLETCSCSYGRVLGMRASLGLRRVKLACRVALLMLRPLRVVLPQALSSSWVLRLDIGALLRYPPLNSTLSLEVQSLCWVGLGVRFVVLCIILGTVLGPVVGVGVPPLVLLSSNVLTRP